jgi:Holliday junction resolvase
MTPEGKIKARVKKVLNDIGAYYVMPMGTGFGHSGVPDFLICKAGLFYAIECKANGNKPTALQLNEMHKIRGAGGVTLIVDETNVDRLRKELGCEQGK